MHVGRWRDFITICSGYVGSRPLPRAALDASPRRRRRHLIVIAPLNYVYSHDFAMIVNAIDAIDILF